MVLWKELIKRVNDFCNPLINKKLKMPGGKNLLHCWHKVQFFSPRQFIPKFLKEDMGNNTFILQLGLGFIFPKPSKLFHLELKHLSSIDYEEKL